MNKKTILCIVPLLFATVGATEARATTLYTYTVTNNDTHDPTFGFTFTTEPIAAATTQTIIDASNLASYSATGSYWQGLGLTRVTLNYQGMGDQQVVGGTSSFAALYPDNLPTIDYSTPGTYATFNDTVVVTAVQSAPEPSTFGLILIGLGLVCGVSRRRAAYFRDRRA